MAVVQRIQKDSETWTAASGTTINVTLPNAVVMANSLAFFTIRGQDSPNRNKRYLYTCQLTSTTNVQFTRFQAQFADTAVIEWCVIEWDSSVTVHRGGGAITAASSSQSIDGGSSINTGSSFPVFTARTNKDALEDYNTARASLSTTDITFDLNTAPSASNLYVEWQVVEFDSGDAVVHADTITLGTSVASATDTISSVDLTKTFVVHGGISTTNTFGGSHRNAATLELTNSTTVQAEQTLRGSRTQTVQYYVVEMLDGTTVQSGSVTMADASTTPSTQPSFTAMTNPTIAPTCYLQNDRNLQTSTEEDFGDKITTQAVNGSNDGLVLTRYLSAGANKTVWYAIDWNDDAGGGGGGPVIPIFTNHYRMMSLR